MNFKKIIYILAIIMAGGAVIVFSLNKPSEDPKAKLKANIGAFQLYVSGLMVAADRSAAIKEGTSCFDPNQFEKTIIKMGKGPDVVDALLGGSVDFATLANTPIVLQALQGNEFVVFATIQTTNHDVKVLGHRSLGVDSPAALNGKRIGFVGGTIGEIFLDRYFKKHNIDKSELRLTSAGPAQLRDLFLSKSLDAIIIWEPIVQDILLDDTTIEEDLFIDVDPSLYTLRMHLVASPETLSTKGEEAIQIVEALICGENVLNANPDAAREQLELWLDRQKGTLEKVFETETFHVEIDPTTLKEELQQEAIWANETIFSSAKEIPNDFSPYVDTTILEAVAPDRVKN